MDLRTGLLSLMSTATLMAQPPMPPAPVGPMPQTPAPMKPVPEPKSQPPANPTVPPTNPAPMTPTPTPSPAQTPATVPTSPAVPAPSPPPPSLTAAPSWPTVVAGKDLAAWLKDVVESKDGSQREQAVKMIPYFGPAARNTALKPLMKRLAEESDPGVRINIIITLGLIGADKPEEAKSVCDALHGIILRAGVGSPVRLHATRALAAYGSAGAVAIPTLDKLTDDPAWETRSTVATTLGRIARAPDAKKGPNTQAMDTLIRRLAKEDAAVVRMEIAQSLLLLGPPAYKADVPTDYARVIKPYLDAVTKRLETETDDATRVWLLMTMMSYDGTAYNDTTVSKIADCLGRTDYNGRYAALKALTILAERAKPALGSMIAVLRNDDTALVTETMIALAAMKTTAKDALPELERIKAGPNDYLRNVAAQAIDIISAKKPPAAPGK